MEVLIRNSKNPNKQFDAIINNKKNDKTMTVSFGQSGASVFTKHKDPERKGLYIDRHK